MNSGNFMLLFLLPFITPIIVFLIIFAIVKNATQTGHTNTEYKDKRNSHNGQDNELFAIIKDAFEKHQEVPKVVQNNSNTTTYSYKDKPEEDYCNGSERSYELVRKEEPIQITSVLDDHDVNFETRLNRLSEDMDKAGCYNFASKDEIKKAVIYSEIINKKY